MDEERSVERLKVFLGGIAFFWAGALLIDLCGAYQQHLLQRLL